MRIIRLDERMVRHPEVREVPLVLGGPARERFHLQRNHSLVPAGISGDERFVKVDRFGGVVGRGLPFAAVFAEVVVVA